MTDDELGDFLAQILNVQRDLQAGQLKLQEGHVELQKRIAKLTTNVNKLEQIVQRHEGYHIVRWLRLSARAVLQGYLLVFKVKLPQG
ncbi:hypothetical protein J5X98_03850 [Leptothermofonsia sichuanensis E412]|uniref:hypothetical protein n=1 Tax=Leptothermofonsia sichuanensis TaxID=2917832 RepID=UPI001CA5FCF0|nr:hypothetical protein [Leptothermofonsia sichuanensis]QZZ21604.1 hypothetical protein J5X98_03850 [Leptothermofonsia sichuanensis E412]